jgi:hypothetical protein
LPHPRYLREKENKNNGFVNFILKNFVSSLKSCQLFASSGVPQKED